MAKTSEQTNDMGIHMKECDKCSAAVDDLFPVDSEDFHAFDWVHGKGYARVAKTARRVCGECIRGYRQSAA